MPTQLNDFNNTQDALTVFVNLQPESHGELIRDRLEDLFDHQQYLYLAGKDYTGEELFRIIREKRDNFEIILPPGQRIVFCYYMPLNHLTREWLDRYKERIRQIRTLLPVDDVFRQYHIACFSYENMDPLGDRKEEVISLLQELGRHKDSVLHAEYLLYASGLDSLDGQERGLVQLLHLFSRRDSFKVLNPALFLTHLKILAYSDYYEDRASSCQMEIMRFDHWMKAENDPELSNFCHFVSLAIQPPLGNLQEEMRSFRKRVPLYPVSVKDYKRHLLFWHRSTVTEHHPAIQKRREEFLRSVTEELTDRVDLAEIRRQLREEMTYQDLCHLQSMLREELNCRDPQMLSQTVEKGEFRARILEGLEKQKTSQEYYLLVDCILCRIVKEIRTELQALEERYQSCERARRKNQRELDIAGKYGNLRECFERIQKDTNFLLPAVFPSRNVEFVTLISGKCHNDWLHEQYEVNDVLSAWHYPEIAPCEIVLLKKGDYIDLAEEDSAMKLAQIFN